MEQLAIKDKSYEEETKELQNQLDQEKLRAERAEKEVEEQKQYALILKELAINDQKRPLDERIYISTSKAYAGHNRFKVGGVERVWINLNLDFQVIMVEVVLMICGTIQTYSR
jgi:hypothetical protein